MVMKLTPRFFRPASQAMRPVGFVRWLRSHPGAIAMAGLLAFAGPIAFLTGTLSIMRAPTAAELGQLNLWWLVYGLLFWCLILVLGYTCERIAPHLQQPLRAGIWLLAACVAAALPNIITAGRTTILISQGVVHSTETALLYAFTFTLVIALLYFAHLRRSREQEQAAERLAVAQMAQRDARRRMVEARLQEMQARIDPQLLFEMLDTARHLYERDVIQGERFLDELIAFLRAALPRLRTTLSSLVREVELAHAYVRLNALAGRSFTMAVDVAPEAMHARFPPGVLLPLLSAASSSERHSLSLTATRVDNDCVVLLAMGVAPSEGIVANVQSLLNELYASSGRIGMESSFGETKVSVRVPYEYA